ncbi:MAG: AbrB/MazE/SpoVT family DNA-binding domain-containing protein [Chloroflexi bacterium]|nr:AbrB/MazE/SpoVT family DNA-binding domain-containing protein [Chloroflexota bacterium]
MVKDMGPFGRCYGSVTVSERGQLVIPADARRELGMETGTQVFIFAALGGRGLVLIPGDTASALIQHAMTRLAEVQELLRGAGNERKGNEGG